MTWAEFRIRLHAHRRMELSTMYKIRELAWVTYIAPHQNPKKMKKSIDSFWKLEPKPLVTPAMKKAIKLAQKEYNER